MEKSHAVPLAYLELAPIRFAGAEVCPWLSGRDRHRSLSAHHRATPTLLEPPTWAEVWRPLAALLGQDAHLARGCKTAHHRHGETQLRTRRRDGVTQLDAGHLR